MVDPGADGTIPEAVAGLGPADLCDVRAVVVVAVGVRRDSYRCWGLFVRLVRAFVAGVCVVLLCAACVPRSEGEQGMNPEQKAAVELAQRLHSIEEFERDVEPAIIEARNEFLTQETIIGLLGNDSIDDVYPGDSTLYTLISRSYTFSETDADRIRDVYDAKLKPLGFTLSEKRDSEMVRLLWSNANYSASVNVVTHVGIQSGTYYIARELRSDGSTENPMEFLPLEGRVPEWLTPELTEKYREQ